MPSRPSLRQVGPDAPPVQRIDPPVDDAAVDENMLMASGAGTTGRLFSAAGFFSSLVTPENLDFHGLYAKRFGIEAPLAGSLGESCYEGVLLLAALVGRARSLTCTPSTPGRKT